MNCTHPCQSYALIGYPLAHTLSPFIHTKLFALQRNKQAAYQALPLPPDAFPNTIGRLLTRPGLNVTIPHKVRILPYLSQLDASAQLYGAVNTVATDRFGRKIGYNTDAFGFHKALKELGASLHGRVLLLGCGGAGRMMAMEAVLQRAALTIAVRNPKSPLLYDTFQKLKSLPHKATVRVVPLTQIPAEPYDLLLNATPVGMFPACNVSPIGPSLLQQIPFLFDSIYNPNPTRLLQDGIQAGARVLGGLHMLVWQAIAAQQIWTGYPFSDREALHVIQLAKRQLSQTN